MKWTRTVISLVVAVLGLVGAVPASAGVAPAVVVHPNWRLVVPANVSGVVADDRYVAIVGNDRRQLRLIDEQTHQDRTLTPSDCFINSPGDQIQLGGSWLIVGCGVLDTPDYSYRLYDLSRGQWMPFAISPQCPGHRRVVRVGRHWVKILSNEEVEAYEPDVAYLQNLQTGLACDPVTCERDESCPAHRTSRSPGSTCCNCGRTALEPGFVSQQPRADGDRRRRASFRCCQSRRVSAVASAGGGGSQAND